MLDGVPRTLNQAEELLKMGYYSDLVIFLTVPDEVLLKRVLGRWEDPVTKKIYHTKYIPAPNEIVGRLITRSDDTEENLRVKLVDYHLHYQDLKNYYSRCEHTINVVLIVDGNRPPNEVYADIHKKLVAIKRYRDDAWY